MSTNNDYEAAQDELNRFNAGMMAEPAADPAEDFRRFTDALNTTPVSLSPEMLADIAGMVQASGDALVEWILAGDRQERSSALAEYVAIAPPEHRDFVARSVARAAMAEVRREAQAAPGQPVPKDMEPEEPPEPTPKS